jgi:glycosyltransferase involved in cell wall biosynthesis
MRVLFVNPGAELGGSERSLLDVLASFVEAATPLEKQLILLEDGELARRARALGVEVNVVGLPDALGVLGESKAHGESTVDAARAAARALASGLPYAWRLRQSVRAFRPDLVHTNGMKAHVLAAAVVPELRRVVHLRDFPSDRPLTRRLLPWLGRRAVVVTNSQAVQADALELVPQLRSRVVYNGIDIEEFRPAPRELRWLAELASLEPPAEDAVVVGLVASYAWWKGHLTFIDAAARVLRTAPRPVRFYVVGGPIYRTQGSEVERSELKAAIERAGLARHVGLVAFQNEVARVYQGLDVLVHASERREPFGRTIVEAMASERAVVVARAGGAAELFSEGHTGLGFRPGDAADLARAVGRLVAGTEERLKLASEARTAAAVRFDRRRLPSELTAVYDDVLRVG